MKLRGLLIATQVHCSVAFVCLHGRGPYRRGAGGKGGWVGQSPIVRHNLPSGQERGYPQLEVLAQANHVQDRDSAGVRTILIDNYDSYTYNLFQQLAVVNGRAPFVVYNDEEDGDFWKVVQRMGELPDNIVISPGPGRPDNPKDFGMCAQVLREAGEIPILAVCLGHEGLGLAHGMRVVPAAEPMHGRLSPILHSGDALFRGVPQGFQAVRYHSLVVEGDFLTKGDEGPLEPTAWTEDGVLMGMRHRSRPHWGLQFHPESVGTEFGSAIVANFRDITVEWCNRRLAMGNAQECQGEGEGGRWQAGERGSMHTFGVEAATSSQRGQKVSTFLPPSRARPSEAVGVKQHLKESSQNKATKKIPGGSNRRLALMVKEVAFPRACQESNCTEQEAFCMPETETVFRSLYGNETTSWWLDSSNRRPGLALDGQAKSRFSYMGGSDGPLSRILRCSEEGHVVEVLPAAAATSTVRSSEGGGVGKSGMDFQRTVDLRGGILDVLREEMDNLGWVGAGGVASGEMDVSFLGEGAVTGGNLEVGAAQMKDLPFDFKGGFVGFLGYEVRHEASSILDRSAGGVEWKWRPGLVKEGAQGGEATRPDGGSLSGHVPQAFYIFADRFLTFDHQEGKIYVVALIDRDRPGAGKISGAEHWEEGGGLGGEEAAKQWLLGTAGKLLGMMKPESRDLIAANCQAWRGGRDAIPGEGGLLASSTGVGDGKGSEGTVCYTETPRWEYEESLQEIMRLVGKGETYEVCLTNQIVCKRPGRDQTAPLELYSQLRRSNPAPYAAFLYHDPRGLLGPSAAHSSGVGGGSGKRTQSDEDSSLSGEEGQGGPAFAVCCSSPERFLKVDREGWIESKPIKGTVKRGATPADDMALAVELTHGEKNMAENLMIVDLVRNDLGRVCKMGSVSVPKLMHVESYATVHQLVSTIRGQLRPGCGVLDAIVAAFPGGSMTGAPKRRTMEIIDRLEGFRPRGVYSGSVGFMSVDGAADLNIVIRTAVVTPNNITVGAGGAVVALSEAEDEYDEMLLKARSVLGAIGGGGASSVKIVGAEAGLPPRSGQRPVALELPKPATAVSGSNGGAKLPCLTPRRTPTTHVGDGSNT
ncbi:unnamed protein product [Discosporangium mesarthrocarpum]